METSGDKNERGDQSFPLTKDVIKQIDDALFLLEFAVSTGLQTVDHQQIPAAVISAIKGTYAETQKKNEITVARWAQFEIAYYQLTILLSPITIHTLRDTEHAGGWWFNVAPALRFTRYLWIFTLAFAIAAILSEVASLRYGPTIEGIVDWQNTVMQFAQVITPYAYGGLGACVYLLRSAHKYIYERSFDMHRAPEYFNRIFLGAIGGGTIILFIDQEVQQGIRLSATALGFLAGYSTDFLFSTIERVISALLPKVGIETMRRSKAMPPVTLVPIEVGVSVKDLLDRHDTATSDEDRKFYRNLIERLSQNSQP